MRDLKAIGDAVVDTVKEYVARSLMGVQAHIAELEQRIASIPAGKDGASVTFDDVMPALREMTEGYLASLEVPAGKDGADGRDGVDGKDGKDGEPGKDGLNGVDGKSVTIDDVRALIETEIVKGLLDMERRNADSLQRTIDRMPVPKDGADGRDGRDGINGKDGRDALDLDDLEYEQDEDGRVTLRLVRGDVRKEIKLKFPVFVDRGVFKEGERYERGNGVTWGGSFWIAQKDDPEGKPGEGDGFRLAVKKGRDAK